MKKHIRDNPDVINLIRNILHASSPAPAPEILTGAIYTICEKHGIRRRDVFSDEEWDRFYKAVIEPKNEQPT